MVSVFFGYDKKAIMGIDMYFNNVYSPDWFDDPMVQKMVEDIDNSKVLSQYCIQSPVLGQIPPERLSGGVKGCICLLKMPPEEIYINLAVFGENCQSWLAKIFEMRDVRVVNSTYDLDFAGLPIKGYCENDNSYFEGSKEWVFKMLKYGEGIRG